MKIRSHYVQVMPIESAPYWSRKRRRRPDISDDIIEYCITVSEKQRDRTWKGVWNAIERIPPSGRILKVVYRTEGKTIKVITAYWIE